jgi:hypothetical protein
MMRVTRKEVVEYVAREVPTSQEALVDIDIAAYPAPHRFTVVCELLWKTESPEVVNPTFADRVLVTVTLYWLSDG